MSSERNVNIGLAKLGMFAIAGILGLIGARIGAFFGDEVIGAIVGAGIGLPVGLYIAALIASKAEGEPPSTDGLRRYAEMVAEQDAELAMAAKRHGVVSSDGETPNQEPVPNDNSINVVTETEMSPLVEQTIETSGSSTEW